MVLMPDSSTPIQGLYTDTPRVSTQTHTPQQGCALSCLLHKTLFSLARGRKLPRVRTYLTFWREFYKHEAGPQTAGKVQGHSPFTLKALIPIGPSLVPSSGNSPWAPPPVARVQT